MKEKVSRWAMIHGNLFEINEISAKYKFRILFLSDIEKRDNCTKLKKVVEQDHQTVNKVRK